MTPIRVALVDDEPLARLGVRARLAEHPGFECVAEFSDAAAARSGLEAARPDVLIVDVQMPGTSGLDLLASWPPAHRPVAILHTAHEQYALRAFELQVVDYLLKPLDAERLAEALGRARTALRQRALDDGLPRPAATATRFEVRHGQRLHYVAADEVNHIEAAGDYVQLHAKDRSWLLREPLHRLAERLDPAVFVRVHRSAIVRIDAVAEVQPLSNRDAMLRLHDGTPLRASRSWVPMLMARLRGRTD